MDALVALQKQLSEATSMEDVVLIQTKMYVLENSKKK